MSLAPSHKRLTGSRFPSATAWRFSTQSMVDKDDGSHRHRGLRTVDRLLCRVRIDRWIDTPRSVRFGIFFAVLGLWAMVPWAWHRWVWSHRRLDQLAKLLRKREPNIGDQFARVIELAESDTEQARSRALCEAAMVQVAEAASQRDLCQASPYSYHQRWLALAGCVLLLVAVSFLAVPAAAGNALAR